jgi:hypothetical protein
VIDDSINLDDVTQVDKTLLTRPSPGAHFDAARSTQLHLFARLFARADFAVFGRRTLV